MKKYMESVQRLIMAFFEASGENDCLAFSGVVAFIVTVTMWGDTLNSTPSNYIRYTTYASIFMFFICLNYIVIKKSIQTIGQSTLQIPFQVYQPEIKYLIASYNGDLVQFKIENEEGIKKSLKKADFIEDSDLTDRGTRKVIESKQTIRGRLVNYTAISVTALVLFYTILRLQLDIILFKSELLFFLSAILILWIAAVLMVINIISRRELLIGNS